MLRTTKRRILRQANQALWQFAVMPKSISLTELEEEGGYAAAHPRQDAAHRCGRVPQHGGVELRGVDVHQGGAGGHGKLPQYLQSHSEGG